MEDQRISKYRTHFTRVIESLKKYITKNELDNSFLSDYITRVRKLLNKAHTLPDLIYIFFIPPLLGIPNVPYEIFFAKQFKEYYRKLYRYPIDILGYNGDYLLLFFNSKINIENVNELSQSEVNEINNIHMLNDVYDSEIKEAYEKFIVSNDYKNVINKYCNHFEIDKSDTSEFDKYQELRYLINNTKLDSITNGELISNYFASIQEYVINNVSDEKGYFYVNWVKNPDKRIKVERPDRVKYDMSTLFTSSTSSTSSIEDTLDNDISDTLVTNISTLPINIDSSINIDSPDIIIAIDSDSDIIDEREYCKAQSDLLYENAINFTNEDILDISEFEEIKINDISEEEITDGIRSKHNIIIIVLLIISFIILLIGVILLLAFTILRYSQTKLVITLILMFMFIILMFISILMYNKFNYLTIILMIVFGIAFIILAIIYWFVQF